MGICGLTYGGIIKDNQEASIVNPLDLEAAVNVVPLGESGLDVPGFKLLREAGKGENTSDTGGELGESCCHRSTRDCGVMCVRGRGGIGRAVVAVRAAGGGELKRVKR